MTVFVSGKVIISGEHSVVYGKTALAASIELGVCVKAELTNNEQHYNEIVTHAVEVAGGNPYMNVVINSELPVGSGLGSSAAVAAATIKEVREQLGKPINNDELFTLAMECEKIAHGNPSGIDPATVIYGGLIVYKKDNPIEKLQLKESVSILLVDTGKPSESTKMMVEMVAKNNRKAQLIEELGKTTEEIKDNLINGKEINNLINLNGQLLEELGVVGSRAKEVINKLRTLGYGVKITGAGGVRSGSGMIMVMGNDYTSAKRILDTLKVVYFETKIGMT